MTVVQLKKHQNRELVASLEEILRLAKDGIINGHVFVLKFGHGDHRAGAAGDYKRFPEEALHATVLMERHLANMLPAAEKVKLR